MQLESVKTRDPLTEAPISNFNVGACFFKHKWKSRRPSVFRFVPLLPPLCHLYAQTFFTAVSAASRVHDTRFNEHHQSPPFHGRRVRREAVNHSGIY